MPQVWRNNLPVLERLIEAGAPLNAQDGESAWYANIFQTRWRMNVRDYLLCDAGSSLINSFFAPAKDAPGCFSPHSCAHHTPSHRTPLHRALYFGNLASAARLLQAGASLDVQDYQCRTPVDLVSASTCMAHPPSTRDSQGAGPALPAGQAPQRQQQQGARSTAAADDTQWTMLYSW